MVIPEIFEVVKTKRPAGAKEFSLFDFVKGMNPSSPAIQALQNRDYMTFATLYNGTGNAHTYADLIQRYGALYDRLIETASSVPNASA